MLRIIKIGGALIENDLSLASLCDRIASLMADTAGTAGEAGTTASTESAGTAVATETARLAGTTGSPLILVHGGGLLAGQLAGRMGIETRMHEGRRITDAATLDITVMAYAGLANKKITAALQARGVNACGLSGCDMGIVKSHRRRAKDIDWGFVGDIDNVDSAALQRLLDGGIVPVISPITFDAAGQLLNTNADSVASAVAAAMARHGDVELTFCLDKPGVLSDANDDGTVIPAMNHSLYAGLLEKGAVHSGMIPKLENAFLTLDKGVKSVRITNPDNLSGGTLIVND